MSRPMIKEHNLETSEIIEREMTDEEFFVFEEQQEAKAQAEASAQAKAAARQAILERLGLTEEEARLLLG